MDALTEMIFLLYTVLAVYIPDELYELYAGTEAVLSEPKHIRVNPNHGYDFPSEVGNLKMF